MTSNGFVSRLLKLCMVNAVSTILAACGGGGGGGEVTPPPVQPVSLTITGLPSTPMQPGQSVQLVATLTYSDSSSEEVTATAIWSTTNAAVLSLSSAGAIVAVAPGQADVVASAQGLSSRGSVRVEQPVSQLTLLAGSLGEWGYVDGVGAAARFNDPTGIATDSAGNLYVADSNNAVIRKITPDGTVTTLAGTPGVTGSLDGLGADARFYYPYGLATDAVGNIYVADGPNRTIRKITPDGTVTTLAGTPGADARFYYPCGLATDAVGNIYVADALVHTIRKITPDGTVTTLAGTPWVKGSLDGLGADARFYSPCGLATDAVGNIYVADRFNNTIRRITPAGIVSTLAGSAGQYGSSDGTGADARFHSPLGLATDAVGNIYVADVGNSTIRKIAPSGAVTTVVGVAGRDGFAAGALPGGLTRLEFVAVNGTSLYIVLPHGVAVVTNLP